jgi:hypothetical protein
MTSGPPTRHFELGPAKFGTSFSQTPFVFSQTRWSPRAEPQRAHL